MYYNNMKINYLVKNQKGITFGGSDTLEGAEEIMGKTRTGNIKIIRKLGVKLLYFILKKANR